MSASSLHMRLKAELGFYVTYICCWNTKISCCYSETSHFIRDNIATSIKLPPHRGFYKLRRIRCSRVPGQKKIVFRFQHAGLGEVCKYDPKKIGLAVFAIKGSAILRFGYQDWTVILLVPKKIVRCREVST